MRKGNQEAKMWEIGGEGESTGPPPPPAQPLSLIVLPLGGGDF